jgi:glycosyltransferase involved in cell wall biosynthesis
LRIAFFVQYSHKAGTYFRWHNLAIALQNSGHIVDVYAGDFNYKAKARVEVREGVRYFITPSFFTSRFFPNPSDLFTGIKRLFFLPKDNYDVYHLFQPFLQAFIPWYYLKKRRRALFFYDWDDLWVGGLIVNPKSLKDKYVCTIVKFLEQKLPILADGSTVCSSYLCERAAALKTEIIFNGFWPKEFISKSLLRKKWSLEGIIFYLAYIGKTAGELNWIQEAFERLPNNLNVGLILCGPDETIVKSSNLLNDFRVKYFGTVSPSEANELAMASDLGLIPLEDSEFNQSRFPIKFFDFLSVGTPVYYSPVGDISKIGAKIEYAIEGPKEKKDWVNYMETAVKRTRDFPEGNGTVLNQLESYTWTSLAGALVNFYKSA